jgi:ribonuclease P/MRP protein subunit POP5
MKILPPTLREKKRYLAVEVLSERSINRNQFLKELQRSLASLFGEVGLSKARVRLLYFDGVFGIVRCAPEEIWCVRAGLAAITRVNGGRVAVRVLGVSGTVRSATEKYIEKTRLKRPD